MERYFARSISAALLGLSSLLAPLAPTTSYETAPTQLVEARESYLVLNDVSGALEAAVASGAWADWERALEVYGVLEDAFLAVHPDDSRFLVLLTTWTQGGFYRPMANEVRGIGLEHWPQGVPGLENYVSPDAPYYDGTPNSRVAGIVSLGTWTRFFRDDEFLEGLLALLIGQETAHAWGAYAWYQREGEEPFDDMLGNEKSHWSLYLHTGASAMEGLDWTDNGDGTFSASRKDRDTYPFAFSDFDLYLMGLLPSEEVRSWFVIRDPHNCVVNGREEPCPDRNLRSHSHWGNSMTVHGTRVDITVDDVIAYEGPRDPDYAHTPKVIPVSFLVLKRPADQLAEAQHARIDRIVKGAGANWERMTRGLSRLDNRTSRTPTSPRLWLPLVLSGFSPEGGARCSRKCY